MRMYDTIEYVCIAIFTAEYLLRLWCCVEEHGANLNQAMMYGFTPTFIAAQ